MPAYSLRPTTTDDRSTACTCDTRALGAEVSPASTTVGRGRRLVALDRAVLAGQVTRAEASERRVELLAR